MKARLVNAWRRLFPHPAAITRREESKRAKEARARRDAKDRQRFLIVAAGIAAQREKARG